MKYTFIDQHRTEFKLATMCRVLKIHRSGYYAWKAKPQSNKTISYYLKLNNRMTIAMAFMVAHAFTETYVKLVSTVV